MYGVGYLLYGIVVEEKDNVITVNHLPNGFIDDFCSDLNKAFNTSKIELHMFIRISGGRLIFDSFFGPDLLFVLETIKTIKYRRSSVATINKLITSLKTNTWLSSLDSTETLPFNDIRLKDFIFDPLPHQAEFFKTYCLNVPRMQLRGYLLAADPGTGKTYTSLALMRCRNDLPTVVISPKVAVYTVWEKNITEFTRYKPTYWISDRDKHRPLVTSDYYIFHYEDLELALSYVDRLRGCNIIIDESHNFTDLNAKRTQQLVGFCTSMHSQDILFMSGTPLKAIGTDAIPIFKAIDPLFTKAASERFKALYGKAVSRAVAVLANRIGSIMFKASKLTKDPIRNDIPIVTPDAMDYTLENIKIELQSFVKERATYYQNNRSVFQGYYDEAIRYVKPQLGKTRDFELYLDYVREIINRYDPVLMKEQAKFCNLYEKGVIAPLLPPSLKANFLDARSVVKYVKLKIQGEALARVVGKRRADCTVSLIPHAGMLEIVANAEAKTVIFTSYVEALQAAEKYFKENGFYPKVVYGDTNKDLSEIVKKFDSDPTANPLIATYKSLSTATPLTMANTLILLDQPFRPYILEQTIARVDRLNQEKTVYINSILLYTKGKDNISTRSRDIMLVAKEMVDSIMGTSSVDLSESLEEFDVKETINEAFNIPGSLKW